MDNTIKIQQGKLYLFISDKLKHAVIAIYNKDHPLHVAANDVSYKNLSEKYLSFLMKQKKLTKLAHLNLDELENGTCFFIAEDLEDEKDVFIVYKNKRKLILDNPFEELPSTLEDFNI